MTPTPTIDVPHVTPVQYAALMSAAAHEAREEMDDRRERRRAVVRARAIALDWSITDAMLGAALARLPWRSDFVRAWRAALTLKMAQALRSALRDEIA